jgi:hypothetical protein
MRRGIPVAVLLATACAVTACKHSSTGALDGASMAPASSPVTSTGPATPVGSGGTGATATPTSAPGGGSECVKSGLTVTLGDHGSANGNRYFVVLFRNSGFTSCRMRGYPGVAALDAGGGQVAQATRFDTAEPEVTLAPGQVASATVHGLAANPDGTACTGYQGLLVTAPDDTGSTRLDPHTDMCGSLDVRPVVPGTTGHQ